MNSILIVFILGTLTSATLLKSKLVTQIVKSMLNEYENIDNVCSTLQDELVRVHMFIKVSCSQLETDNSTLGNVYRQRSEAKTNNTNAKDSLILATANNIQECNKNFFIETLEMQEEAFLQTYAFKGIQFYPCTPKTCNPFPQLPQKMTLLRNYLDNIDQHLQINVEPCLQSHNQVILNTTHLHNTQRILMSVENELKNAWHSHKLIDSIIKNV